MYKKLVISIIFVLLIVEFIGCIEKGENILLNSDFEEGSNNEPSYQFQAIVPADNQTMGWDNNVFYNGRYNVDINNSLIYENDTCNNWAQSIGEITIG